MTTDTGRRGPRMTAVLRGLRAPGLAPWTHLYEPPAPPGRGAPRTVFLGVSTILLDDGDTAILTDGFFSRPGLLRMRFGRLRPDRARIAAGLGVIPRVVGEGRAIMQGKLTLAEAERRIRDNWHPYHDRLRALIAEARALHGMAILVDCHSMPHDALNATRAAVEEGIVPGGGVALLKASRVLDGFKGENDDQEAGVAIVRRALQAPIRQIAENAGVEGSIVVGKVLENASATFGFNAQTEEYVDLVQAGVIDPAKVVRTALQDAASVAGLLITTEAAVSELPEDKPAMAMGGGGMGGMGGMDF